MSCATSVTFSPIHTNTCISYYSHYVLILPCAITCGRASLVQANSLVWGTVWLALDRVQMPTTLLVLHKACYCTCIYVSLHILDNQPSRQARHSSMVCISCRIMPCISDDPLTNIDIYNKYTFIHIQNCVSLCSLYWVTGLSLGLIMWHSFEFLICSHHWLLCQTLDNIYVGPTHVG